MHRRLDAGNVHFQRDDFRERPRLERENRRYNRRRDELRNFHFSSRALRCVQMFRNRANARIACRVFQRLRV